MQGRYYQSSSFWLNKPSAGYTPVGNTPEKTVHVCMMCSPFIDDALITFQGEGVLVFGMGGESITQLHADM